MGDGRKMDNPNIETDESLDRLYDKPRLSKKEKFKNFIYYYKSSIILAAVAIGVLAVLIGQVLTKTQPDVYLMYAGRYYIDPKSYQSIQTFLSETMNSDYNGDGNVMIEIINKTVKTYEKHEQDKEESEEQLYTGDMAEALAAFQTEIAAGESIILFLDTLLYDNVKEADRLIPLKDALGYTPEGAMDEYGILLGNTPFANAVPEFKSMLNNTVVCVKRRIITCDQKVYNNNLDALKKLFEAEYPQPEATTAIPTPPPSVTADPTKES